MATAFANSVFLAWVRQGLAATVSGPDPLTTPLPTAAAIDVALDVNGARFVSRSVKLFGPGEVIGIDPRQVVRTEPPRGSSDFESNNLAAIEFDNPDLPWLFTPAAANAQGQLRPWLCLVVVRKQEGVRFRAARDEALPVLEIAPPAKPADELPDLGEPLLLRLGSKLVTLHRRIRGSVRCSFVWSSARTFTGARSPASRTSMQSGGFCRPCKDGCLPWR